MARNPIVSRGAAINDLDQRMNASGGISAGAHPEFSKPTTIDNMVSAAKSFWNQLHGPKMNPAAPATPPPAMSKATEDSLSQKYLGR